MVEEEEEKEEVGSDGEVGQRERGECRKARLGH